MSNTPRIEGTPDPRQTSSTKKESSIDPEKFKKILKVDESEETEKRRKRNLTKSEEDSDDEIDEIENSTTPETLFSTLMGDSGPTTSIFDAKDGTKQPLGSTSDAPASSYGDPFSSGATQEQPPLSPPPLPQPIQEPSISEPGVEGEISASSPQTESSSSKDSDEKRQDRDKEKPLPSFKKEKLEEHPAKQAAKMPQPPVEKKNKPLPITPKKVPSADIVKKGEKEIDTAPLKAKEKEKEAEKPREDISIPLEPKKEASPFVKESIVDELSLIKKTRTSQSISREREEEKRDKDTKHLEESQIGSTGQQNASPHLAHPMAPPEIAPTYAHLNQQAFELFERMVGLITIEQSKGVSTTTVKISLPGTVYHGSEIKLDHYDTAPHSFNIQLLGSPEAVKSFSANFDDLAAAFRGGKFAFSVNLLQPELLSKQRHLIKRKSGPDEKGNQDRERSPN